MLTKKEKIKGKKKETNMLEVKSNVGGVFGSSFHELPPSGFSPYFGEKNFLVDPKKKYPDPTIYFSSPSPNQTLQKSFSSHFISKSFCLPYFTSNMLVFFFPLIFSFFVNILASFFLLFFPFDFVWVLASFIFFSLIFSVLAFFFFFFFFFWCSYVYFLINFCFCFCFF